MTVETKNVRITLDSHRALSIYAAKKGKKIQSIASQVIFLGLKKLEELESKRKA